MPRPADILISGLGVVSPIGTGMDAFRSALAAGRNGIGWRPGWEGDPSPLSIGGLVRDFDGRNFIKPRKAMKVMCREIQFGCATAGMAVEDAGLDLARCDLDRVAVIFGAETFQAEPDEVQAAVRSCLREGQFDFELWGERSMRDIQPLWMLKYLPNMVASHISIALAATGPNNTICQGDVSAALAVIEAATLVRRGWADIALAGGTGSRVQMNCQAGRGMPALSHGFASPETASRPFHPDRNGYVCGEGAATVVLESAASVASRQGKPRAALLGWSRGFSAAAPGSPGFASAIARQVRQALEHAEVEPRSVAGVHANGTGAILEDRSEAGAIRNVLPDAQVFALKSLIGNAGAASAAIDLVAAALTVESGRLPASLNAAPLTGDAAVRLNRESAALAGNAVIQIALGEFGQIVVLVLGQPPN